MHNDHIVVVNAEDKEEAQFIVEEHLNNFGDDNNWFSITDVIDLSNYTKADEAFVNKYLEELNNEFNKEDIVKHDIEELQKSIKEDNKQFYLYHRLSEKYEQLYNICSSSPNYSLDNIKKGITKDYHGYEYDEFGITHMYDDKDNLFIVIVDMHS